MTSGTFRVFSVLGRMLTHQSTELFLNFTRSPGEDGRSRAGTKLDHGLLPLVTAQFLSALTATCFEGGTCSSSSCTVCLLMVATVGFKDVTTGCEQVPILAWVSTPCLSLATQTSPLSCCTRPGVLTASRRAVVPFSALKVVRTTHWKVGNLWGRRFARFDAESGLLEGRKCVGLLHRPRHCKVVRTTGKLKIFRIESGTNCWQVQLGCGCCLATASLPLVTTQFRCARSHLQSRA